MSLQYCVCNFNCHFLSYITLELLEFQLKVLNLILAKLKLYRHAQPKLKSKQNRNWLKLCCIPTPPNKKSGREHNLHANNLFKHKPTFT